MPAQTKSRAASKAGKRYPLNMRTTKVTRDRLEKAAAKAGRSLAQEVETRLEMTFEWEGFSEALKPMYQRFQMLERAVSQLVYILETRSYNVDAASLADAKKCD